VALLSGLGASLGGCGTLLPGHFGGIATAVSPEDYAERLCGYLDLEDYPSCVGHVLDYFEQPIAQQTPAEAAAGPFAVAMDGGLYMGSYSSTLFDGTFRVSNGANGCRGSFNVLSGSRDALYDVYCDDGRSGWADLILSQDGRNGIGQLALSDGAKGQIVFGYAPLDQARPYAYGDAWLPPATQARNDGPY
jgi:hypothetical protein